MKSNKSLVLIGMMGSGKSTIGFLLSKTIGLEFVDIDSHIEKEEGIKIHEIFKSKGEKYFRKIELVETLKILNRKNIIISLGGGAFIDEKIRKKILSDHFSVWLNWNSSTIINESTATLSNQLLNMESSSPEKKGNFQSPPGQADKLKVGPGEDSNTKHR